MNVLHAILLLLYTNTGKKIKIDIEEITSTVFLNNIRNCILNVCVVSTDFA